MNTSRAQRHLVALTALVALGACSDNSTNEVLATPTTISITASSNGQTGVVGTALASPLSVSVLNQLGLPISGAPVAWTVVGSRGTLSSPTSTSDANGLATVNFTLGNTAGTDSVIAVIPNGASVTLTATGTAASFSSLVLFSGDSQTVAAGTVTQPLMVLAIDQFGNAVGGVPITWATTGGGVLSATSSTTDASGMARVTLTTNSTAGPYTVTASSGTATPIVFHGSGT